MLSSWKYLSSFLFERTEEKGNSKFSPGLKVEFAFGKFMLNTGKVNYAFGTLDTAFRSAFEKLSVADRNYEKVLLLGLGPGNVPEILREYGKPFKIVGVDIDPEVIRLGKKWFGLGEMAELDIVIEDACTYVQRAQGPFDLIVVDLFIHEKVPAEAEKEQFLRELDRLLAPGGLLVYNRLTFRGDLLEETQSFFERMQVVLPDTRSLKVKATSNLMLIYEKPNHEPN